MIDLNTRTALDQEGLPRLVDIKTMRSMDYLRFSCAISYASAAINRIDRLMVISYTLRKSLMNADITHVCSS
jgi:hypothetical protein